MSARFTWFALLHFGCLMLWAHSGIAAEELYPNPIDLSVPHISTDKSVKYDYPIVYVRVPRKGDNVGSKWAEIAPQRGRNKLLTRIVVGMCDYYTGLDPESFKVSADFAIDNVVAGENLAAKFKEKSPCVWELKLATPIAKLERGVLTVSVTDMRGNKTETVRTFSVE